MTKRHADNETVADIVRLRKENEQLRKDNEVLQAIVTKLTVKQTVDAWANAILNAIEEPLELKEDAKWKALK
jgi:cell division protein FtsB